ncbi:hypothetical protein [Sorangium sp. So ce124]|uniref:hypothetical protein n=1 Tax=Sorangium sp. So ce124 TaxID=3133280 RepID=UPI003F5EF4B0
MPNETPKTYTCSITATIETYRVNKDGVETDNDSTGWLARLEFDSELGDGDPEIISPRRQRRSFATEEEAFEEAESLLTRRLFPVPV